MAIKILGTPVIDDLRNVLNILNPTFSAPVSMEINSSQPPLTVEQQGAGIRLLAQTQTNDTSPVIINSQGQLVIGATTNPTPSADIVIDNTVPELSLNYLEVGVSNGFSSGWSFQNENGVLRLKHQQSADFTVSNTAITFSTNSNVGINRNTPTHSLDVQTEVGIYTDNSGLLIFQNNILSVQIDDPGINYKPLDFESSTFKINTGMPDSTATTTLSIDPSGTARFDNPNGGLVIADQYEPNTDWVRLGFINFSLSPSTSAVFTVPPQYNNFAIVFENIVLAPNQFMVARLANTVGNIFGGNTYRVVSMGPYIGIANAFVDSRSGEPFWIIKFTSAGGSYSGLINFYNLTTTNSLKSITGQVVSTTAIGGDDLELIVNVSGDVNTTSIVSALQIVSSGTISSGKMTFYGIT